MDDDGVAAAACGALVAAAKPKQQIFIGTYSMTAMPAARPVGRSPRQGSGIVLRDVDETGNVLRVRRMR